MLTQAHKELSRDMDMSRLVTISRRVVSSTVAQGKLSGHRLLDTPVHEALHSVSADRRFIFNSPRADSLMQAKSPTGIRCSKGIPQNIYKLL